MNTQEKALELCKGSYQRNLVLGRETLGGSTLRGKAKSYMGRYDQSARNLISRLRKNEIEFEIKYGPRGGWYSATLEFKS
jgi:hypothetical protein